MSIQDAVTIITPKDSQTTSADPKVVVTPAAADPNLVRENQFAQAVARLGDSKLSVLIGAAFFMVSIIGCVFVFRWDGHMYDRRGCTKMEQLDHRVFVVNSCEGVWQEVPPGAGSSVTPSKISF